jgi:hypothetical protein
MQQWLEIKLPEHNLQQHVAVYNDWGHHLQLNGAFFVMESP